MKIRTAIVVSAMTCYGSNAFTESDGNFSDSETSSLSQDEVVSAPPVLSVPATATSPSTPTVPRPVTPATAPGELEAPRSEATESGSKTATSVEAATGEQPPSPKIRPAGALPEAASEAPGTEAPTVVDAEAAFEGVAGTAVREEKQPTEKELRERAIAASEGTHGFTKSLLSQLPALDSDGMLPTRVTGKDSFFMWDLGNSHFIRIQRTNRNMARTKATWKITANVWSKSSGYKKTHLCDIEETSRLMSKDRTYTYGKYQVVRDGRKLSLTHSEAPETDESSTSKVKSVHVVKFADLKKSSEYLQKFIPKKDKWALVPAGLESPEKKDVAMSYGHEMDGTKAYWNPSKVESLNVAAMWILASRYADIH